MSQLTFHSILTVLSLGAFVALVIWLWGFNRTEDFESVSRIPLESDDEPVAHKQQEKRNG